MVDDPRSEWELIRAAQSGDKAAFGALCLRHGGLVAERIRRWVHAPMQRKLSVQDVVQETYLAAFLRLGAFEDRGPGAFPAWLAQIAEFKAREALRHHVGTAKRDVGREVSEVPGAGPPVEVAPGASPSQVAVGAERAEAVQRAMAVLPADYREVLSLVQVGGLSLAQAAEVMGRSYEATKKLYGRALTQFGRLLGVERDGAR